MTSIVSAPSITWWFVTTYTEFSDNAKPLPIAPSVIMRTTLSRAFSTAFGTSDAASAHTPSAAASSIVPKTAHSRLRPRFFNITVPPLLLLWFHCTIFLSLHPLTGHSTP